jgi:hypothetical protein
MPVFRLYWLDSRLGGLEVGFIPLATGLWAPTVHSYGNAVIRQVTRSGLPVINLWK